MVDSFTSERFENFSRNALFLFQTVLVRYGSEYEIKGKVITLRRTKGAKTGFSWRYEINVKIN
ncbi:phage tail protein [Bacillus safensis]|uniref:phage tail protein n=1 Tax=Bacillus safensis TaxID=561879 RepID=UPI003AA820C9